MILSEGAINRGDTGRFDEKDSGVVDSGGESVSGVIVEAKADDGGADPPWTSPR
jgi:hypothetical protein